MKKLDELLTMLDGKNKGSIILMFEDKKHKGSFDEHDKKHIRILATLQLAHDKEVLEYVLNHKFNERFKYDKDREVVSYEIRFVKERKVKKYADA